MLCLHLLADQTSANIYSNVPLHAFPPEISADVSIHLVDTRMDGKLTVMQVMEKFSFKFLIPRYTKPVSKIQHSPD